MQGKTFSCIFNNHSTVWFSSVERLLANICPWSPSLSWLHAWAVLAQMQPRFWRFFLQPFAPCLQKAVSFVFRKAQESCKGSQTGLSENVWKYGIKKSTGWSSVSSYCYLGAYHIFRVTYPKTIPVLALGIRLPEWPRQLCSLRHGCRQMWCTNLRPGKII